MTRKSRINYLKAISHNVERKKMYKAKKQWVVAGISFLVATGMGAIGSHLTTHAQVNNPTTNRVASGANTTQKAPASASNANSQKSINNMKPSTTSNSNVNSSVTSTVNTQAKLMHRRLMLKAQNLGSSNSSILNSNINQSISSSKGFTNSNSSTSSKNKATFNINNTHLNAMRLNVQSSQPSNTQQATKANWIWTKNGYINSNQVHDWQNEAPLWNQISFKYSPSVNAVEFTSDHNYPTSNWSWSSFYANFGFAKKPSILRNANSIKFDDSVKTNSVTNMNHMFADDTALRSLQFASDFDTSNVSDMGDMFLNDINLQSLNLSNWDTSKVKYMNSMFDSDTSLQYMNISNWDTSKVSNMANLFNNCYSLQDIKGVSDLNTRNSTNVSLMFRNDQALKSLTLGDNFDTSKSSDISAMFGSDKSLTKLVLPKSFITTNATNMTWLFNSDNNLKELDLNSDFDTRNAINHNMVSNMLSGMNSLQTLKLGKNTVFTKDMAMTNPLGVQDGKWIDLNDGKSHSGTVTFPQGNYSITGKWGSANWSLDKQGNLTVSDGIITDNPADAHVSDIPLNWNNVYNIYTKNVTAPRSIHSLFSHDNYLETLDLSGLNTLNTSDMSNLADSDMSLQSVKLNGSTNKLNNMSDMFGNDSYLQDISFGNIDTSNVKSFTNMFNNDVGLQNLDLSKFDTKLAAKTNGTYNMLGNSYQGFENNPAVPNNSLTLGSDTVLNSSAMPSGEEFTDSNTNKLLNSNNFDGKTAYKGTWNHISHIATDTIIFYDRNGQNEVSQYSDVGNYGSKINIKIPSDFELVNSTPQTFNNGTHEIEVQVKPSDANNPEIVDALVTGKSNTPKGHYEIIPTNPHNQSNKPSDVPAGKPATTPFDPADNNDTEYITINDYNGKGIRPSDLVNSYTKRITINGNTGYTDTIKPSDYSTTGYSDTPSDTSKTVTINSDEGLTPQTIAFNYQHQPSYTHVIFHYTDDNGQQHTIDGNVHNGTVGSDFLPSVPSGYHYVDPNQSGMIMAKGDNGNDNLYIQGNKITGTAKINLVYKDSTGNVISSNQKTISLNKYHVGDSPLIINANKYGKSGYEINNNSWSIPFNSVNSNGTYTPSHEFDYTGVESGSIEIQFFDADYKMDKIVGNPQYLHNLGPADTAVDIKLGAKGANDVAGVKDILQVPKGYKLLHPITELKITLPDKESIKHVLLGLFTTSSKSGTNSTNNSNSGKASGSIAPSSASAPNSMNISMNSSELSSLANEIGGDINVTVRPNVTNTAIDNSALNSLTSEVATNNQEISSLANKPVSMATINYSNFDALINNGVNKLTKAINTDLKANIHHTAKTKTDIKGFKQVKNYIKWVMITKPVKLYNKYGVSQTLRPNRRITLNVKSVYKVHNQYVLKISFKHHIYFVANNKAFKNSYLAKGKFAGRRVMILSKVYEFRHKDHDVVKLLHKGSILKIRRIIKIGNFNMTRIQLSNGNWISANKNFVKVL